MSDNSDLLLRVAKAKYHEKFSLVYQLLYKTAAQCDGHGTITVGKKQEIQERDKAESIVRAMGVDVTGARAGETLIGVHSVTRDAKFQITTGSVGFYHRSIIRLLSFQDLWELYLNRLANLDFFSQMTITEREIYIYNNIYQNEDLSQSNLVGMFISEGTNNKIAVLDPEIISNLLNIDQSITEHKSLFPNPRNNDRNTLVFLSHFWKIYVPYISAARPLTYVFGKGFMVSDLELPAFDDLYNVDLGNNPKLDIEIKQRYQNFRPSELKSALQKYIRHRPRYIDSEDTVQVTMDVFDALLMHPGSFVPDIQRYVSGQESALKRLLVSVFEDAYYDNTQDLLDLAVAAHISQVYRNWSIPATIRQIAHRVIRKSIENDSYWDYRITNSASIKSPKSNLEWCSYLLDRMKSFEGDLNMLRIIASNPVVKSVNNMRPESLPGYIYIDQHCYPNIIYHLPTEWLKENMRSGAKPFAAIFDRIFREYTGVNSRRATINQQSEFVKMIMRAQQDSYYERYEKLEYHYYDEYTVKINSSLLSGEVGVMETNTKPKTYVCLDPLDSSNLLVIRKPTRDSKTQDISAETTSSAKQLAATRLRAGINTRWGRLTVTDQGAYINGKPYDQLIITNSVEYNEDFDLSDWLSNPPTKTFIKSVSSYLGREDRIQLPDVSRDGGYNNFPIRLDDLYIARFFRYVAKYSSLMDAKSSTVFSVSQDDARYLQNLVMSHIQDFDETIPVGCWGQIKDELNRIPRPYQQNCLQQMLVSSRRGEFLWLDPGAGKTWICSEYIRNKLEDFSTVIYTLPSSALKSVIAELQYFNYPINYWNPTKRKNSIRGIKSTDNILAYHINIIEHDHLRLIWQDIVTMPIMDRTIFVVDEVHKTLNNSLRSQAALAIANAAKSFLLMTGTPIIDYNTHKLIWWLRELVDFRVTDRNFWVAAMSMVNMNIDNGLDIIHQDVIPEQELPPRYYDIVSPSLGGKNKNMNRSDLVEAMGICQAICDTEMIELTVEILQAVDGVVLVAANQRHQLELYALISKRINPKEVLMMTEPVNLVDNVPYRVIIIPQSKSEGYNLTFASVMITGIYASNNATRTQLEGRINRLGQKSPELYYYRVHKGLLSRLASDYRLAANIQHALSEFLNN